MAVLMCTSRLITPDDDTSLSPFHCVVWVLGGWARLGCGCHRGGSNRGNKVTLEGNKVTG